MSDFMSGLGDQAGEQLQQHGAKVGDAAQQAGDFVDEKTGGKYSDQIDSGVSQVEERFGGQDPAQQGGAPEQGGGDYGQQAQGSQQEQGSDFGQQADGGDEFGGEQRNQF